MVYNICMSRKKIALKKSPLIKILKNKHIVKTERGGFNFWLSLSVFFFLLSGLIFADTVSIGTFATNKLPENATIIDSNGTISKVVRGEIVPVENVELDLE